MSIPFPDGNSSLTSSSLKSIAERVVGLKASFRCTGCRSIKQRLRLWKNAQIAQDDFKTYLISSCKVFNQYQPVTVSRGYIKAQQYDVVTAATHLSNIASPARPDARKRPFTLLHTLFSRCTRFLPGKAFLGLAIASRINFRASLLRLHRLLVTQESDFRKKARLC
jgi:hypothetical protein